MPLFFNNPFNNFQNRYYRNNNFMFNNVQNNNRLGFNNMINNNHMNFNPMINNNQNFNNQPNNVPSDVTLTPLTEEELEKINQEIQENIEKNRKNITIVEEPKEKDIVCKYIEEFIQDETNANKFYNQLANKCSINIYRDRLKYISDECVAECNHLKSYYKDINKEEFSPKSISINTNIPLKAGLFLAIEEEIKSYDKLCKIVDDLPPQDTRIFYRMALKKLSRINSIQYMAMNEYR